MVAGTETVLVKVGNGNGNGDSNSDRVTVAVPGTSSRGAGFQNGGHRGPGFVLRCCEIGSS